MGLKIKLLGVRGSLPTPYKPETVLARMRHVLNNFAQSDFYLHKKVDSFLESQSKNFLGGLGGNTTCVEVASPKTRIIIDGGSGIRHLVGDYMSPERKGENQTHGIHILFTHFHWDHICGLPFFAPFYIPNFQLHLYSVQPELEEMMRTAFKKPYFPVPYEALASKINYHYFQPRKKISIGDIQVTPYLLDHPDPCWGYRIEHEGRVYAHCVDTEATRMTPEELGEDRPLYQNANLMLFDGHYSQEEAKAKVNWGHSSAPKGLTIALREKIQKVVFVHHDPWASDDHLISNIHEAQQFYESEKAKHMKAQIDWEVGVEGQEFDI